MRELKLLINSYEIGNEDIYLKAFYGMSIAKIEQSLQNAYRSIKNEDDAYFLYKLENDSCYKKIVLKRISNKINSINLNVERDANIELLKLFVYIDNLKFNELNLMKLNKYRDLLYGHYSNFPQDVKKLDEISIEFFGDSIFEEYEFVGLQTSGALKQIEIFSTEKIDIKKNFYEIYSRRQESLHLDLMKSIDYEKLRNHMKCVEIVLQRIDEFMFRNNCNSAYVKLINNINCIKISEFVKNRIKKKLELSETEDVLEHCKDIIIASSKCYLKGYNIYIEGNDKIVTINKNYTVITAGRKN